MGPSSGKSNRWGVSSRSTLGARQLVYAERIEGCRFDAASNFRVKSGSKNEAARFQYQICWINNYTTEMATDCARNQFNEARPIAHQLWHSMRSQESETPDR